MIPDAYIDEVLARLAADKRVRRELPVGGRLYCDRQLPFLCVYRRAAGKIDLPAEQLVSAQTAFLIMPGGKAGSRDAARLLHRIAKTEKEHFGGFLILEVWLSPAEEYDVPVHAESGEPLHPVPLFRVHTDARRQPAQIAQALTRSLGQIRLLKQSARVEWISNNGVHSPGCRPILSLKELREIGCHIVGVEIWPIFRNPADGEVFPDVLRSLVRSLGRAFNQTFHAFSRLETNLYPHHYHTLGRHSFVKAVWEVDRQLAEIESSFDLLLQATPINAEAAWLEFRRQGFQVAPTFQYRPLAVDTTELKRRLFQTPIERVEDATLAYLFLEKQDYLDRKITMLSDVGTSRFLPGSIQIHGGVKGQLVELADDIITQVPIRARRGAPIRKLQAEEFRRLALEEIKRYESVDPSFQPRVEVRDDLYSGLLVSQSTLLVGRKVSFPSDRVEALLQHEIGTHLITYHNGSRQPFRQLALGLAGYDLLQEGLAVFAEYLVGGLNRSRARLLAGRVLAVQTLLDGAGFVDTFRLLNKQMRFGKRIAYTIAMRVHRAGGLTKDAVYLQGLVEILDYLGRGGKIESLLTGKIAADHIPLVEELRLREILRPPPLRPHYLDCPHYAEKIARVCRGINVLDLIKE